jgi:division protein CdvB (Snf7/Vps24/ESCRT-III family)
MSQLNTALDRLDSAIDRLQSAISTRQQRAGVAQERLTVELRDVKATHAILEAEARNVSTRLDSVIGRLKTLLEA